MFFPRKRVLKLCVVFAWLIATYVALYIIHISTSPNLALSRERLFSCDDHTPVTHYGQRGKYWVLYNYFKASKVFACDQSITFTTHGEWNYLDNVAQLLKVWQGPLSLTVYAPGTDFAETCKRIQFLRECVSSLVKELVTFHVFFEQSHIPENISLFNPDTFRVNCSETLKFGKQLQTFRQSIGLTYPINVGRNIAREMATTHYLFPCDIELYPSPNFIMEFLEMIKRNESWLHTPGPKVFVLPVFELEENVVAFPKDKIELLTMLRDKSAIVFHEKRCGKCHYIPEYDKWLNESFGSGLNVSHIGKRHGRHELKEPFYVGTKYDPIYDERLSREGEQNKYIQGFVLCALDYSFYVLNNAFLVHTPGIKRRRSRRELLPQRKQIRKDQDILIDKVIVPELQKLYGAKPECAVN